MFKKIKLFYFYFSIIKKNKKLIYDRHKLKTDYIYRLFTTITIPEAKEELIKNYGYSYINGVSKTYIKECQQTFIDIGLHEFIKLNDSIQLNNTQIGISFTYKYANLPKVFNRIIFMLSYILINILIFLLLSNILYTVSISTFLFILFFIIRKIIIKKINLF